MCNGSNLNEYELLNIPQAAKLLNIAPHTFRVWLCTNKVIPKNLVIKLGGTIRIYKQDFLTWIKEGCKSNAIENKGTNDKQINRYK